MKLTPVQPGVDYDRPTPEEAAKCKILAKKIDGHVGWIVESPDGVILRKFVDTNDDNVVDQWSYYKDGLEVYRDIDSNFNGKADQYRWFHTGGSRWGVDTKEDGSHRLLEVDLGRRGHGRSGCGHRHARRRPLRAAGAHAGRVEVARAGQSAGGERGREDRQSRGRLQGDVGPAEGGRARRRVGAVQRQPAGRRARRNRRIDQGPAGLRERGGDRRKRRKARPSADRHAGASGRRVAGDRPAADRRRGAGRRDAFRVLLPGRDGRIAARRPAPAAARPRRNCWPTWRTSTARRPRRPRPRSRPTDRPPGRPAGADRRRRQERPTSAACGCGNWPT